MLITAEIAIRGTDEIIRFAPGSTTIIVGPNGAGKTQLAVECEQQLGERAHRISAQRMLAIDTSIAKVGEAAARNALRYGYTDPTPWGGVVQARGYGRWGSNAPKFILDDSDALLQVLFAEQANTAVAAYNASAQGSSVHAGPTYIQRLCDIFHRVLPTRNLAITADEITVYATEDGGDAHQGYPASQMSDGEKAVFYLIGQVLVADADSVFIMDEPEVHVHRSILGALWDELETARPDCAFLLITHDLQFAAARPGEKFVVRSFSPVSGWVVERVPEATEFSEDLVTLILGSRKPILFVEGDQGSLDVAFYRAIYPDWTVVPRGGCETVIHSVRTMRNNAEFTRVYCAGIVDRDDRDEDELAALAAGGIYALPVAEVENLLLLPSVSRAILEMDHLAGPELEAKLAALREELLDDARQATNLQRVVVGFTRRRVDRLLKVVDLSHDRTVEDLAADIAGRLGELDVTAIATDFQSRIEAAVADEDLPELLSLWDRKAALLVIAARWLRGTKLEDFKSWVVRAIQSKDDARLRDALRAVLPEISAP